MSEFKNAFIFHGTAGSPEGNWFPWLKNELEQRGIPTSVPRFPTPDGESLDAWFAVLDVDNEKIGPETLLIGHSKGGMFLLKVLERLAEPVKAAIFVAAPVGEKPILYYEEDKKFSNFDFKWNEIVGKAQKFIVYHSDNDPYVSLANGEKLANELSVGVSLIPNAGHLNAESGFTEFQPLLAQILALM